jgi:MoaA/NifB/PqqE/SkfB family radical SAM enzyme
MRYYAAPLLGFPAGAFDAHGEGYDWAESAAERGRLLMRTGKSLAPVGGPTGVSRATDGRLSFLWLEITGRCQLACRHCYAESGPRGTHGSMTTSEWMRVIDEAGDLGALTALFIGGEPTLHPDLPALIGHALGEGMQVEVFSNLVHVAEHLWRILESPGVRLATSYYSPDAKEHDAVTGRRSHDRTLANIREALRRGIPVRAGIVAMRDDQRVRDAARELAELGVADVNVDRVREVGRGVRHQQPGLEQLCGACAGDKLAVSSTGDVWPCVFARWLVLGNVQRSSLADIHGGQVASSVRATMSAAFAARVVEGPRACGPDDGSPGPGPCDPHYNCPPFKPRS